MTPTLNLMKRIIFSFLCLFSLSSAAWAMITDEEMVQYLVGTWQTIEPTATGNVAETITYDPNGNFQETLGAQGSMGFVTVVGHWAPKNGKLLMRITSTNPPNAVANIGVMTATGVQIVDDNTFKYEGFNNAWRRQ